jgi:hypothetical protein
MRTSLLIVTLLLYLSEASARQVRECATCHPAQAKFHPETSMAHAMELPGECRILATHPAMEFRDGRFSYRIERKGDQSVYSVSDGRQTMRVPIGWAFGLGLAGQTYIYEHDGKLYQSRVSYYKDIDELDLTLGARNSAPADVIQAAGLPMSSGDSVQCFGCHATAAVDRKKLTLDKLVPGVQCERCHGSVADHLNAVKVGDAKKAKMTSLRNLTSEETSNFCGQCHRTWSEISESGIIGVQNVRFQPYRLTNSKCYDADDRRIRCTSCHDPHLEVKRNDAAYDSNCAACHGVARKPGAKVCKVARSNCASCHMPKVEIPGSHHKFTDHNIRIARANAPYPE